MALAPGTIIVDPIIDQNGNISEYRASLFDSSESMKSSNPTVHVTAESSLAAFNQLLLKVHEIRENEIRVILKAHEQERKGLKKYRVISDTWWDRIKKFGFMRWID